MDFDYKQIVVRDAKGNKDRVVPLPQRLIDPLREHLIDVKALFEEDLKQGCAGVYLPNALARKYPNAPREWIWPYVFPSARLSFDPAQRRGAPPPCPRKRPAKGAQEGRA